MRLGFPKVMRMAAEVMLVVCCRCQGLRFRQMYNMATARGKSGVASSCLASATALQMGSGKIAGC
jgi:hypothetical protein